MSTEIATKYKETDIGNIPEEWGFSNIEEFFDVKNGKTNSVDADENGIFPLFDRSTEIKRSNKYLFDSEAVIIPGEGADFIPRFYNGKFDLHQRAYAITPKNGKHSVNIRFLFYWILAYKNWLSRVAVGSTVKSLRLGMLTGFPLAILPKNEQDKIVDLLLSIDGQIELIKSININLEKLSSCLFKQYFVDSKNDWPTKKLSDLADITIGRTPPRMQFEWFSENPKDIKWISIRDLGCSGVFINRTAEYLTKEAIEKFNIPLIPKKTVILSFKLTVGRVAITAEEMLSNEAIAHIKITDLNISPEYIYFILKRFDYSGLGTTSSIANAVNSKTIKDMDIPLADDQTIKKFTSLVAPIFDLILENTKKLESLTEIKELILPKLMSGNIRVK